LIWQACNPDLFRLESYARYVRIETHSDGINLHRGSAIIMQGPGRLWILFREE